MLADTLARDLLMKTRVASAVGHQPHFGSRSCWRMLSTRKHGTSDSNRAAAASPVYWLPKNPVVTSHPTNGSIPPASTLSWRTQCPPPSMIPESKLGTSRHKS